MARARQATGVFFAALIDGPQLAATVRTSVLDLDVICQVLDPEATAHRLESLPLGSVACMQWLGEAWRGAGALHRLAFRDRRERDAWKSGACTMWFVGSRQLRGRRPAFGIRHTVCHTLRSLRQRLSAWRITHWRASRPDEVVIGTLRRPRLAIAIRATVVRTETTPPPILVFLERIAAHPLDPYCPRCSLPLERWQADPRSEGTGMGYECRPCGTQIRWTPADVLKQMQREVRRHYARYWAQYQEAIRQHERGAPRIPAR